MSLKSVIFITSHLSYNKGDIAGFPPATALDLCEVKKVAKPYVKAETDESGPRMIEVSEARKITEELVAQAKEEADQKMKDVERRTADQDAREAALKAREEAVKQAEAAATPKAGEATAEDAEDAKTAPKTAAAKPPKQGAK